MGRRGIKLTPSFQRSYIPNIHDTFRVRVVASEPCLMPQEIFAYRMLPLQPGQAAQVAVFDHVCSPVDLADYPVGAPRINDVPPWFRQNWVIFDAPTRQQALDVYDDIVADVASLVTSLDNAELMEDQPSLWIGCADCCQEGVSSSEGSESSAGSLG